MLTTCDFSLAWAELYLTAGTLFREGGPKMKLFETTEKDVLYERDFYAAFPSIGTKGDVRTSFEKRIRSKSFIRAG